MSPLLKFIHINKKIVLEAFAAIPVAGSATNTKKIKFFLCKCWQSIYWPQDIFDTTIWGRYISPWKWNGDKWSAWADSCLIKHLYKTTTNQMWSFLAGFVFFSNGNICLNKDLQLCMLWCQSWKLKMFSFTFHFEHTYIKKWG